MSNAVIVLQPEKIEKTILLLRGERVMLDDDLATLYGVTTKALVQAVKRNLDRFPADFLFQLSKDEVEDLASQPAMTTTLRSQSVISKKHGGRRYLPYAFTEQGVSMLSSVLRSKRAVLVNVEIMRAFVRLRQLLASNAELARKLDSLEKKYDVQFKTVFDAIRQLMTPPAEPHPKGKIGFGRQNET